MGADVPTDSVVYKAARTMFAQNPRPNKGVIGRKFVNEVTGVISAVDSTEYVLMINDSVAQASSGVSATPQTIAEALKTSADNLAIEGLVFTSTATGFTITSTQAFSVLAEDNIALSKGASSESWTDAILAVNAESNEWYGLSIASHLEADILEAAATAEGIEKLFGTSSSDPAIKGSGDTDVASKLKALGYDYTFIVYHPQADEYFPEAGMLAGQLQAQAGSSTWAYKPIAGVPSYYLSTTESRNLTNKNVNSFEEVGGVRCIVDGKLVSGEWIDVTVFLSWLKSRLRERIWFRFANSKKISMTDAGMAVIQSEILAQLAEGQQVGGIADLPAPQVFVPQVLDLAPNLRATRVVEGVTFTARLAGAIHKVQIRGTVTV